MAQPRPRPISATEQLARAKRVSDIARLLGFVGRVEYRHVYSRAGGAQYGLAGTPGQDLLIVYAEAFDRDANPDDFSLSGIIAHECGHQLLARHDRLTRNLPRAWSSVSEEIVASVLGSLLVNEEKDRQDLLLKAIFDAEKHGLSADRATILIMGLRAVLEEML
jgi:hypothetical protein